MKRAATSLLLVLALTGCASTHTEVSTDYDPAADFSRYQTYAWREGGAAADPAIEERIRAAIDGQLTARGLRKVTSSPDLQVTTYASLTENKPVEVNPYGYGHWPGAASITSTIDVGTLLVDLVDASTQKLVWRGIANATVGDTVSQEQANRVAAKLFARYPPKR